MPLNQNLLSLRTLVNKFSPCHCISSVLFLNTRFRSGNYPAGPYHGVIYMGRASISPLCSITFWVSSGQTEKDTRTAYFLTNSKQFTECSVPGFVLKLHWTGRKCFSAGGWGSEGLFSFRKQSLITKKLEAPGKAFVALTWARGVCSAARNLRGVRQQRGWEQPLEVTGSPLGGEAASGQNQEEQRVPAFLWPLLMNPLRGSDGLWHGIQGNKFVWAAFHQGKDSTLNLAICPSFPGGQRPPRVSYMSMHVSLELCGLFSGL